MMKRRRKKRRGGVAIMIGISGILICGVILGYIWLSGGRAAKYPLLYMREVRAAAAENGVPAPLIASVIMAESSYRAEAVSSAGAVGLMQIMPDTGEWISGKIGVEYYPEILYDTDINIKMGAWYLGFLYDMFAGDLKCACAAYHQGQGTVGGWLTNPEYSKDGATLYHIPSQATRVYIDRIMTYYEFYENAYSDTDNN